MLDKYRSKIDAEQALLVLFIGVAVYMLAESFRFHPDAANFPQIMAVTSIALGALLLFRNFLPTNVREYLMQEETISTGSMGDDDVEKGLAEAGKQTETRADTLDRPIHPSVFTAIITVLYLLGGYLFGFFWVTPVLVIGYLLWYEQPIWKIVIVTLVSTVAVYGFVEFLNMPYMGGAVL